MLVPYLVDELVMGRGEGRREGRGERGGGRGGGRGRGEREGEREGRGGRVGITWALFLDRVTVCCPPFS